MRAQAPSQPVEAPPAWEDGPSRALLGPAAVHVWRCSLGDAEDSLLALLSTDERKRASRIADEHRRTLWARSHAVLRALLGAYAETDPASLEIGVGEHGKPYCTHPRVPEFNLSHSATIALCALSSSGPVGVDVERTGRRLDAAALATRAFPPEIAAEIARVPHPRRQRAFLRAWVRHEAEAKCLGVGLARGGTAAGELARGAGSSAEASGSVGAALGESRPTVRDLPPLGPLAAAVAWLSAPLELRCWRWPTSYEEPHKTPAAGK